MLISIWQLILRRIQATMRWVLWWSGDRSWALENPCLPWLAMVAKGWASHPSELSLFILWLPKFVEHKLLPYFMKIVQGHRASSIGEHHSIEIRCKICCEAVVSNRNRGPMRPISNRSKNILQWKLLWNVIQCTRPTYTLNDSSLLMLTEPLCSTA